VKRDTEGYRRIELMVVSAAMSTLLDDLRFRGLIHQITSDELEPHLEKTGRRVYAGFDPTRDALTIGNLLPILLLRRFQLAGHRPVVVMGGGTGLVGDPSGKEAERPFLSQEDITRNIESQRETFSRLLNFDGPHAAEIVDNATWLSPLSYLELLRDVGKHFSVNMMIQKDSVRERLQNREQGITYTEFSYMILQAYDFRHLFDRYGVTLQVGGSDQWGNILGGVDLIRRTRQAETFGLSVPLLTKSDGRKFGKTEAGAVWLSAKRTTPYAFYQFWLNAADSDVGRFLRIFTLLGRTELEMLEAQHDTHPERRLAQHVLAEHVTALVHGEQLTAQAKQASEALFSGEVGALDADLLDQVFADAPSSQHQKVLLQGEGLAAVELLTLTGMASSKREAREWLGSGAISINGNKVGPDYRLAPEGLLHGTLALVRRGKKTWHVARWQ
jgi:tyrosyl-tRNA synthetase